MFSKDIDLDSKIILKNKIPLLIYDNIWIKLFGGLDERTINSSKKELKELIKKQQETERALNKIKLEKKKVMGKIINLSDVINNGERYTQGLNLLNDLQTEIYKINEEIEDLTFELEILPQKIREANLKLLKATVKYAYKDLNSKEKELKVILEETDLLKEKLRLLLEQKYDYEESINDTYSFLHGFLGGKEMERLDKDML